MDDDIFFRPSQVENKHTEIGELSAAKNDTRIKGSSSLLWSKTSLEQAIRVGDAVFTGKESEAKIHLKKGGSVDIGENSMVVFSDDNGTPMAKINFGKFKIDSNGTVKLAINGKVTTINSKNSNIEVKVSKDQKPEILLVKGQAEIEQQEAPPIELTEQKPMAQLNVEPIKTVVVAPPAEVPDLLIPENGPSSIDHTWRLDEVYEQNNGSIKPRAHTLTQIAEPVILGWSTSRPDDPQPVVIQFANNAQFKDADLAKSHDVSWTQNLVYVGDNFWRISRDGAHWSETRHFNVNTHYLQNAPEIVAPTAEIPFLKGEVDITLQLQGSAMTTAFVVEQSSTKEFQPNQTNLIWAPSEHLNVHLEHEGTTYFRARSVASDQALSQWSSIQKVTVSVPARIAAPRFKRREIEALVGDEVVLELTGSPGARRYQIEVTDEKDQLIESREIDTPSTTWSTSYPGKYQIRGFAIDNWERKSEPSKPAEVHVAGNKVTVESNGLEDRVPSSEGSLTVVEPATEGSTWRNTELTHSYLELSGFYSNFASSQAVSANLQGSNDVGVGFKYKGLWGDDGLEVFYDTAVVSPVSNGIKSDPQQLEGRYLHRFFIDSLQWSFLAGYESFHNTSGGVYAADANLIKLGTNLQLPILQSWVLEGEFTYGFASDGSKQYDGLVGAQYFFVRQWSVGADLHLRLFQAGSLKSSPGSLPFREGTTDTITTLRYYF
jgi:hypothetical protein